MERRTTLLVHAGASSLKRLDQQAIAYAESYLSLHQRTPTRIIPLSHVEPDDSLQRKVETQPTSVLRSQGSGGLGFIDIHRSQYNEVASATEFAQGVGPVDDLPLQESLDYIDDTQLAYTTLESQLYSSSAVASVSRGNQQRTSIRLAGTNTGSQLESSQHDRRRRGQGPWATQLHRPIPDVLSEQSDGLSTIPATALGRQVKRQPVMVSGGFDQVQSVSSGTLPSSAPAVITPVRHTETHSRLEGSISSDETTSELPSSYSWGDSTSNGRSNSLGRRPQLCNAGPRTTDANSNGDSGSPLHASHTEPLGSVIESSSLQNGTRQPEKGETVNDQLNVETVLVCAHATVPNLVATTDGAAHVAEPPKPRKGSSKTSFDAELKHSAVEIHARRPAVSIKEFETHVTKELRAIRDAFGTIYKPIVVSRQISTHERGHWSINCAPWSSSKKLTFWRNLQVWVENGSAGWGVWCTRKADQQLLPNTDAYLETNTPGGPEAFDRIRVYCWGETVEHVYILLYTASEGGVRKLGLQWIDAEDKVVIQMNGRKE